jgi:hypothetical protein
MERFLEPIELNDAELRAVAGGLFNISVSNSVNNFANISNSANNSASPGVNSVNVAAAVPVIV